MAKPPEIAEREEQNSEPPEPARALREQPVQRTGTEARVPQGPRRLLLPEVQVRYQEKNRTLRQTTQEPSSRLWLTAFVSN